MTFITSNMIIMLKVLNDKQITDVYLVDICYNNFNERTDINIIIYLVLQIHFFIIKTIHNTKEV